LNWLKPFLFQWDITREEKIELNKEDPMSDENGHVVDFTFKGITGSPIERVVYKAVLAMGIISAVGLTAMMLVSIYDITMRFFFSKPIYGVYELVGMILVLTSSFGFALCQKDKAHITITLITDMLPARLKAYTEVFGMLMSLFCYGLITWVVGIETIDYFERGTGSLSGDLGINLGYISAAFFVGCLAFTVVLCLQTIQGIGKLIRRK
jgi:TRAP-type C4-dicarboxylate transport system permease small subunit